MADLLQILKGTGAKPRITFYANGVPSDLDSGVPVVTIAKPDLTTIASGTVSKPASTTGIYEFTLGAQAECTYLTVTWAGPIGGVTETLTTFVEVVGAHLFTVADLRGLKVAGSQPFSSTATPLFTDQQIMDARAAVLDEFTTILGFSPVPRFRRKILNGDGSTCLNLPDLKAHRLISVTVNGVAQTVAGYQLNDAAQIEAVSGYSYGTPFTWGRRNVVVEYAAGWPRVLGEGRDAAMVMAAKRLDSSGFSNYQSVTTPDGVSYSYEPSETGRGGFQRHTGVRDLDRWLNRHSQVGLMVA